MKEKGCWGCVILTLKGILGGVWGHDIGHSNERDRIRAILPAFVSEPLEPFHEAVVNTIGSVSPRTYDAEIDRVLLWPFEGYVSRVKSLVTVLGGFQVVLY